MMLSVSRAEGALRNGQRATLLCKDIVLAFNNTGGQGVQEELDRAGCGTRIKKFVEHFLKPRTFQIGWDGLSRGSARMDEGTPQGSPISPVLLLIYIGSTVRRAQRLIEDIPDRTPHRESARTAPSSYISPTLSVRIFSYSDGVHPLWITTNRTRRQHEAMVNKEDDALVAAAPEDELLWDKDKDCNLPFDLRRRKSTVTLGIRIQANLKFDKHKGRTTKAEAALNVLLRLGDSRGGCSPKALRVLYTGQVRAIFSWGGEVFHHPSMDSYNQMQRLEYKALLKITGGYRGSAHTKLGLIANIKPINAKLSDISSSWAARVLRTGDREIREFLDQKPSEGCPPWYCGNNPHAARHSAISRAFYYSGIDVAEISIGDRDDTSPINTPTSNSTKG